MSGDSLGRGYGQLYLSGRSDRVPQLAHISLLDGKNNAYLGLYAGASRPLAGGNNTFVGSYSGANASAEASVFLGLASGRRATRIKETCLVGYKAGELAERVESSVCVGAYAGRKMTRANCNTLVGFQAGAELTSGSRNTVIGSYAAFQQFNGSDNVCIGYRAGYKNQIGANNTYVGTNAGFAAYAGAENVCLGVGSGEQLYAGARNVLMGFAAGSRIADASNCIAIGTRAMQFFSAGDTNTCLGTQTARYFSGNNNTILGGYSVGNAAGSKNAVVGSNSLNRRNAGRVQIDRCVVVGENVTFDVETRTVTLAYPDATVPAPLTPDLNADIVDLTDATTTRSGAVLFTADTSPIGDNLLPPEHTFGFGSADSPLLLDISRAGAYDLRWGLNVDPKSIPDYSVGRPARYGVRVETQRETGDYFSPNAWVTHTVRVSLTLHGAPIAVLSSMTVDTSTSASYSTKWLALYVTHTSAEPEGMTVYARDQTADMLYEYVSLSTSRESDRLLGAYVGLSQADALIDAQGRMTIELDGPHGIPAGGEVWLTGALYASLNGVWTVVSVPGPRSVVVDAAGAAPVSSAVVLGVETTRVYLSTPDTYAVRASVMHDIGELSTANPQAAVSTFFGQQYVASAQPTIGSGSVADAWNHSTGWCRTMVGEYDTTTGVYLGAEVTTTAAGVDHPGAWIQLARPAASLAIDGYTLDLPELDAPWSWSLLGSGDGGGDGTWDLVDARDEIEPAGDPMYPWTAPRTYAVSPAGEYTHFRLVVRALNPRAVLQGTAHFRGVALHAAAEAFAPGGAAGAVRLLGDYGLVENGKSLKLAGTLNGTDGVYTVTAVLSPTAVEIAASTVPVVPFGGIGASVTVSVFEPTTTYAEVVGTGSTKRAQNITVQHTQRSDAARIAETRVGPSYTDGHVHQGAGTTETMHANLRLQGVLEFTDEGTSYAAYTVGSENTLLAAGAAFRVRNDMNIEFGLEWLASCKLSCALAPGGAFDIQATSGLVDLEGPTTVASVTQSGVLVQNGSIAGNTLPADLADVLTSEESWVTLGVTQRIATGTSQLEVRVRAEGGAAGWYAAGVQAAKSTALTVNVVNVAAPSAEGATVRYYANAFTAMRNVSVYNERYRSTPVFANVVYLGSDHVVSEVADRTDVCIVSLGKDRILRANVDEFRMFSRVAHANLAVFRGGAVTEAAPAPAYTMTVNGSFAPPEVYQYGVVGGQALHVLGHAQFDANVTVSGTVTAQTFIGNGSQLTGIVGGTGGTATTDAGALTSGTLAIARGGTGGSTYTGAPGNVVFNVSPVFQGTVTMTDPAAASSTVMTAGAGGVHVSSLLTTQQLTETVVSITGASGAVTHDFSQGALFHHSAFFEDFTCDIVGLPVVEGRASTVTLLLRQGVTPFMVTGVSIAGDDMVILWFEGTPPDGTAAAVDVVTFTLLRLDGAWTVFGQCAAYK